MKRTLLISTLAMICASCNNQAIPTGLASGAWKPDSIESIKAAYTANGPWTLAQSNTALATPLAGFCDAAGKLAVNTTKQLMQPYYFPFITGSDNNLEGWFDYRVKDHEEALVHGTSSDGGINWIIDATKLRLNSTCPKDSATPLGNDAGQGHAIVLNVGSKKLLYTLNREASQVDKEGLLIHDVTGGTAGLADSEPVSATTPVPAGISKTVGLINPDGILGVVPNTGTSATNPLKVMYLAKYKGKTAAAPATGLDKTKVCLDSQSQPLTTKKANFDRTEMRLATTTDGIAFTDIGLVKGLNNPDDNASTDGFRYVGPRGTLLQYNDKTFGLFFSGGNCQDGDSDAYHFIGYATSSDAVNWTVVNGAANPLVQVNYKYPVATPAAYFSGRVYDPNVIVNSDGTAKLIFSGYRTGKPLPDQNVDTGLPPIKFLPSETTNYRTILILKLSR